MITNMPLFRRPNPFLRFCKPGRTEPFHLETVVPAVSSNETVPQTDRTKRISAEPVELVEREDLRRDDESARLEAVLFLAREPLSSRKLAQFADIEDGSRVRRLLRELNQRYDVQPCAFRIVEVGGGYQLRTRAQFSPWLVRLQEVPIEVRLSSTAMETLAIVAFKQPVLRADVESIRGVQCGEVLRQLSEKNLIKIVGRSEELGRPFLYGTTPYFLQVFGLNSINDLRQKDSAR